MAAFDEEQLKTHQPVGRYTLVGYGGVAEYLVVAQTSADLITAVKLATQHKVPYVLIGSGSGVLFSNVGFPGLVIINQTKNLVFSSSTSQVTVDGGYLSGALVNSMASRGLGGIEFLAAIPGTIGGAVATGAAWGGKDIRTFIKELVVFVPDDGEGKVLTLTAAELPVDKKSPLFDLTGRTNPIILSVKFQVAQLTQPEILRRLQIVRSQRSRLNRPKQLGHVFRPSLADLSLGKAELAAIQQKEIQIHRRDHDLIEVRSDRIGPGEIRRYLESAADTLGQTGYTIGIRLGFVGYWPDGEEHGSTKTNT